MTDSGKLNNDHWMGGTRVPNIVLWPISGIFVTLLAMLASFMHQDRNRLAIQESVNARQDVDISQLKKDNANLMSMWNSVSKTMNEMDRKMDRLMP